jgi:hypothetical protein
MGDVLLFGMASTEDLSAEPLLNQGQVRVVTGGGSGIGLMCVRPQSGKFDSGH